MCNRFSDHSKAIDQIGGGIAAVVISTTAIGMSSSMGYEGPPNDVR